MSELPRTIESTCAEIRKRFQDDKGCSCDILRKLTEEDRAAIRILKRVADEMVLTLQACDAVTGARRLSQSVGLPSPEPSAARGNHDAAREPAH